MHGSLGTPTASTSAIFCPTLRIRVPPAALPTLQPSLASRSGTLRGMQHNPIIYTLCSLCPIMPAWLSPDFFTTFVCPLCGSWVDSCSVPTSFEVTLRCCLQPMARLFDRAMANVTPGPRQVIGKSCGGASPLAGLTRRAELDSQPLLSSLVSSL